ncbi:Glycine cleavage system H protein [Anatilimnocola aggregata]|uniref:Glycine cleavage system H protein n=1 Tax=Anatilimnocola aggregata TaxID=2528021 RepID=A0A517Y5V8_9BACT|nr:glycine cleavage system protein H [Anatilimnocola aggregata]QDU25615.1 Glycine cleavage system H protein [Anatilimnocola aggregata]
MSEPLTFEMGKFVAEFPVDRLYAKNHMWAEPRGELLRFGFSAYAVRLLQDVYFLDWSIDAGTDLKEKQEIGSIESKKAESSLYSPVAGRLLEFNQEILSDPSSINVDKYGAGWIFEMQPVPGLASPLLTAQQYLEHLAAVWEVTQRTIKGQMNE